MTRRLLRTPAAARYLQERYGVGNAKTLSKKRVTGLDCPEFIKIGRAVVYDVDALDNWAQQVMSKPLKSTSDTKHEIAK